MNTYSVVRSTLVVSVLLFGSRAANAACVITGVRPTVPLPTMAAGQEFSFIATADCERLRFRVPGTTLTKIPKAGPDVRSKDRTYKVVLTEREWSSVVDETDTTFAWSIIGMTSAGITTRVTTTNDLDIDDGVTVDLSLDADAELVGGIPIVSDAGDVNADGNDDLLISAFSSAYLVLGAPSGTVDLLSEADATFLAEDRSYYFGLRVAHAGDVDGDDQDDVLLSAPEDDEGGTWAGAAYLIQGPVTGEIPLSMADAKLVGVGDIAGEGLAGVGDVNGDGCDDVLIGAYLNSEGGTSAGAAYLVLGPVTGTVDLSTAQAKLVGEEAYDAVGTGFGEWGKFPVSAAGDVNGDGLSDLLAGAYGNDEGAGDGGAAYLVLGPVTGTLNLSLADAKLLGEEGSYEAGASVSGNGDVDGDGHDDLLVGSSWGNRGGELSGTAYLVLGPATGKIELSSADAILVGEGAGDYAGWSVAVDGDVDADGHADLLIGSLADRTYLLRGPVEGTLGLEHADVKFDDAGWSVAGGGDFDADGLDDVFIDAYVVYGSDL